LKKVVITGASSGIGRALALEFAKKGYHLGLTARRYELLKSLQTEIRSLYGDSLKVELKVLDVTSFKDVFKTVKDFNISLGGIDLVIANAGMSDTAPAGTGHFVADKAVYETNLLGAIATVEAAIEVYKDAKRQGQVVGISSIAGIRGLPERSSYCASKAAFTTYLESVRADVRTLGITVTTLLPGFIDTPINNHMGKRPFVIGVSESAKQIVKLIEKKVSVSTVPRFPWAIVAFLLKWMPEKVLHFLARRNPG
jgi:short-subunit dehydrogenase